nr:MAG TPA: Repressor protein CI [Caudoviricetes sp.]
MDYVTFDKLCKENGTTATAIALKLGLSKGNTSSWKKGGNPSADILIKIADELNCTVDVLLGRNSPEPTLDEDEASLIENFKKLSDKDKGKVLERAETLAELAAERAATQKKEPICINNKCLPFNTCELRYYDNSASAGTGLFLDEAIAETLTVRNTSEAQQADYAIPVSGDSMENEYHDGDIVLVKSCPCVSKGEVGIFLLDGSVYIKEYGGKCLISYNENYPPIDLSKFETAACLGKVLGIAEVVS